MPTLGWCQLPQGESCAALLFNRHQPSPYLDIAIAAAGLLSLTTLAEIVKKLAELGHRRIVILSREMRRVPELSEFEKRF